MRRRFTEEFKAEAVKQVTDRGCSVADVSERLGISTKSLYLWLRKAKGSVELRNNMEAEDFEEKIACQIVHA